MDANTQTPIMVVVEVNQLKQLITDAVQEALSPMSRQPSPSAPSDRVLSLDQVRVRLGLSAPSVRKAILSGRLKATRVGRRILIAELDLKQFMSGDDQLL